MGLVEIRNLTKVYDEGGSSVTAVEDLSLEIADGEFLVLVGPSGCGKSTTLRCLAGLERPTDGDILIDGSSVVDLPPKDRGIAMVFQNYALYPHMTAYQNISFGLRMGSDLPDEEIERRVEKAASMMGIADLLSHKPGELSGGQQQRVALGRAIVREPAAFLLDEPLSNLDAKLRAKMRTELQDLQARLETTTLYVTHDQTEAMTMGDRIAVLNDGTLQQVGTPMHLYEHPRNVFVAGFLGTPSMNFLPVEVTESGLRHADFESTLPIDFRAETGTTATLGVRPEHVSVSSSPGTTDASATVNVVEPMGDVCTLTLSIGEAELTASVVSDTLDTMTNSALTELETQTVGVSFNGDRLHLFDSESGERVPRTDRTPRGGPNTEDSRATN